LRQLIRHAQGQAVTHTGGEIVWQLRGFQHLLICWRPCHEPRESESSLLQAFRRSQEGKLPFANRQNKLINEIPVQQSGAWRVQALLDT
jgi:hypothetical protein